MQEPIRDDEAREITLGPDPLSEALRSELRERLVRVSVHREHPFRNIVNTDFGIVNTQNGIVNSRFGIVNT